MKKEPGFFKCFTKQIVGCIVLLPFLIFDVLLGLFFFSEEMDLPFIGVVFLVLCLIFVIKLITGLRTLWKTYNEMKNDISIIEKSYSTAKNELKELEFNSKEHYSSFGYKWIEYRNKFQAIDNLHIEIDHDKKLIACYMLLPYYFFTKTFDEIISVEIETDIEMKPRGLFYKSILVMIKFTGEDEFCLSMTDNIGCYEDDPVYVKAMEDGKKFKEIILSLKENA